MSTHFTYKLNIFTHMLIILRDPTLVGMLRSTEILFRFEFFDYDACISM